MPSRQIDGGSSGHTGFFLATWTFLAHAVDTTVFFLWSAGICTNKEANGVSSGSSSFGLLIPSPEQCYICCVSRLNFRSILHMFFAENQRPWLWNGLRTSRRNGVWHIASNTVRAPRASGWSCWKRHHRSRSKDATLKNYFYFLVIGSLTEF